MTPGEHHKPAVAPLAAWKLASAAFAGGALGSLGRGVAEIALAALGLPAWPSRIAVNVLGAFLIGCLFARIAVRDDGGAPVGIPHVHRMREHLLGAGFLGGFTTVSGMAWDVADGLSAADLAAVSAVLVANAVVGLAACASGFAVAARRAN